MVASLRELLDQAADAAPDDVAVTGPDSVLRTRDIIE
jgi:hypothetical protein